MGRRKQKPFNMVYMRMRRIHLPAFLLASILFFPVSLLSADKAGLLPDIRSVMDSPRYQHARWGLFILDLASDKTIYSVNADTMFGPASVTKLFTAAAALDGLGRDFCVRTTIYQQGAVDKSGRLNGDLILVAKGDAFLSDMRALAAQVKASGIKAVKGDIIIDDRLFKPYRAYSVARPGKLLYTISPVVVHDNVVELTIKPARIHGNATVTWLTAAGLRVVSRVRTVGSHEPEKIDILEDAAGRIIVSGQIPEKSPPVTRTAPVGNPSSAFRALLIDALKKAGIRVQVISSRADAHVRLPDPGAYEKKLKKVAERVSPPLADYLRTILKASHNQGADMLPLLLAVKNGGSSFEEGMRLEKIILSGMGIDLTALSLSDGSGISPANLVTPRVVVQLLKFMTTHKDYEVFRDGLPLLGVDGTLSQAVGDGSPAKGKVLAKTGTIGLFDLLNDSGFVQIKALAGYMTAASGRPLAFALFVNHVHTTDAPDRKTVLKMTNDVGADLARIAELIYIQN